MPHFSDFSSLSLALVDQLEAVTYNRVDKLARHSLVQSGKPGTEKASELQKTA